MWIEMAQPIASFHMAKTSPVFKVGDNVTLNANGQLMTVAEVGKFTIPSVLLCKWHAADGSLQEGLFTSACVTAAQDSTSRIGG